MYYKIGNMGSVFLKPHTTIYFRGKKSHTSSAYRDSVFLRSPISKHKFDRFLLLKLLWNLVAGLELKVWKSKDENKFFRNKIQICDMGKIINFSSKNVWLLLYGSANMQIHHFILIFGIIFGSTNTWNFLGTYWKTKNVAKKKER